MGQGEPSASGLDGVVVAETRLSDVDGERGRLVIAGSDVEALAGEVSFEEICARLWSPFAPVDESAIRRALGEARGRAFAQIDYRRAGPSPTPALPPPDSRPAS